MTLGVERDEIAAKAGALEDALTTALSARSAESDRMVAVNGHSWARPFGSVRQGLETDRRDRDGIAPKVEAEGEVKRALSENSRLLAEREALVADRAGAAGELQTARDESSRLAAERDRLTVELARREVKLQARAEVAVERDALLAEKSRLQAELEAARSTHSLLLAEHEREKSRLEREIEAARHDTSRLVAARDRLTVEIARYQIKHRAQTELTGERERLAAEAASWCEAAVAAAHARRFLPEQQARHLKLSVVTSGLRLRCSISRSRWERSPRMSLALADGAFNAAHWQLAARCYADVLEHWPKNAAVWVQLGHSLKEAGRVDDAEAVYRHALQLNPTVADAHLQLGHALKLKGRIREAGDAYAFALGLDPGLQPAAAELQALGWSADDIEKAKAQSRRSDRPSLNTGRRRRFTRLALQRMSQ